MTRERGHPRARTATKPAAARPSPIGQTASQSTQLREPQPTHVSTIRGPRCGPSLTAGPPEVLSWATT